MKTQLIIILAIIAYISFSCEKDSDIKLPATSPKLAVYGFLSPEDTITNIIVKESVPYFGVNSHREVQTITNAQVIIRYNESNFALPYNANTGSYFLDSTILKIIPGGEYFLEVSAEGFTTVYSSLIVPQHINNTLEYIDYKRTITSSDCIIDVKWVDDALEKNYYRLTGYVKGEETYPTMNGGDTTVVFYEPLDDDDTYLYEDSDWNGQTKTSHDLNFHNNYTTNQVDIMLLTVDYHYYQYHRSVRDFENVDENPFAEPVIVYTNIQNGVGVFASYRKFKIEETISLNN